MKKIKSFFLNKDKKYTTWGLICNWAIIITPFVLIGISFALGNIFSKLDGAKDVATIKQRITGGDAFVILIWFIVFVFMIYIALYKIVRLVWKPKKVRQANKTTDKKESDHWG